MKPKKNIGDLPPRPKVTNKHAMTFDHTKDQARQEFKSETDVRTIISRHGGIPLHQRPIQGGITDYDMNLQKGLELADQARAAWAAIPAELRRRYGSWEGLQHAIAKGELVVKDGELQFAEPAATPAKQPVPETGPVPDTKKAPETPKA